MPFSPAELDRLEQQAIAADRDAEFLKHHPEYRDHGHADPVFASILNSIQQQPEVLQRAAEKASPRRFSNEPPTGFGALDDEPDLRTHEQRSADHAEYLRELRDDCAEIDEREDQRLDGGAA